MFLNKILKILNQKEVRMKKNKELNPTAEKLYKLTGFVSNEIVNILKNQASEDALKFLIKWAEVTRASLRANTEIISNCLITDSNGHVLCRFCGEGIPNWKEENAREHSSDCPIELACNVLGEVRQMRQQITDSIHQN